MQATSAPATSISQASLTRDMYALASYLMRRSHVGTFNRIAELDLSFTQIKTLCAMDFDGTEPSVKSLAESMKVSLPAMSRAVDGLYERGMVDRYEDPEDRRMKRIRLTELGRGVSGTLNEARLIGMQAFLTSLSEEEASALGQTLELILASHPDIAALRPAEADVAELPDAELSTPTDDLSVSPAAPPTQQKGATP